MKKITLVGISLLLFQLIGAQVGIQTDRPEKELHVDGTTRTNDVIFANPIQDLGGKENYSFLVKGTDKRIATYGEASLGALLDPSPINLITFKITTDPTDKDWVNEFDTKIDANNYTVLISSYSFNLPTYFKVASLVPANTSRPTVFSEATQSTPTSKKTWKLKADYGNSTVPDTFTEDGIWTIHLLVLDNAYVKTFNNLEFDMGGSRTGSSGSPILVIK